jgi:formylglycine-generating enzyme required for sulfatase activity
MSKPSNLLFIIMTAVLLACSAVNAQETPTEAGDVFKECVDCPEMVIIPPGSFTQGYDGGLEERYEGPRREITISYSFAIGRFEVTQAQYRTFIETSGYEASVGCFMWNGVSADFIDAHGWEDPDYGRPPADDEPVACLNWTHVDAYVSWLAAHTGQPYRLVSEAEWEYVARAGRSSDTSYVWGEDESEVCLHGNVLDQSAARAQPELPMPAAPCDDGYPGIAPVGQFSANPFGVYDITGNVWEWLQDCYVMPYPDDAPTDGSAYINEECERRAVRGGSWISTMFWQRPTFRGRDPEDLTSRIFGLRVARDLP